MDYTRDQRDAIFTHDRNLIVTAGAGSGKTRVLVDRFVAVLDAHPDWRLPSLVAITFTEKAAREMRDRVRQSIEQKIAAATEAYDDPAVRRWRAHEAALDSARIGTIHGLCAAILRANAAEIGIDPGFGVLDEVDAAILSGDVLDLVLAALADEGHPAAQLISEYGSPRVRRELIDLIGLPEESWPKPAPYLEQWTAAYQDNARQQIETLRGDAEFMGAVMWETARHCADPDDKLMQGWSLVIATCDSLTPDTLTRWRDEIKLSGGKAAAWGGKEQVTLAKEYLRLIRERAAAALESIGTLGDADEKAAALLPLWGEAAARVKQVYQAAKQDRRVLDFDDLERLTRKLLQNAEVAARYRDREFRHILVDEFQDTNHAQRDIIYALADLDRPGSLFLVGDPRQSIYKFRGADVSVFDEVRADIVQHGGREIPLDMSFRTHQRLVDELNAIFSRLMTRGDGPTAAYEVEMGQPMTAFRQSASDDVPCMEIILIDKDNAAGEDHARADDLRRWEAWALAQRLNQMVGEARPVWDKQRGGYRPIQYGDVAILFQATRSMPLVEEIFKATGIPYVTVAGKGYFNRPEVEDLRNLLEALYNPFDNLALAAALRSPLFGLSDETLLALRCQRSPASPGQGQPLRLPLWDALTEREAGAYDPMVPNMAHVRFASESLRRLRGLAGRVTIAELLEWALDETAYLATLTGLPDGARRCGNVEKLVEVARRSQRITLGEFTAYLQDLSEREAREGEALLEAEGAVHLMTVHASKGLEFPVVALFDASWERKADDAPVIIDPQLGPACSVVDEDGTTVKPFAYQMARRYDAARDQAERTRLLYVGMTRAQDYVIISGQNNKKGQWLNQLREALNLPEKPEDCTAVDYRLSVPKDQPGEDAYTAKTDAGLTGWDQLDEQAAPDLENVDFGGFVETAETGESWSPPLVAPPLVEPHTPAGVLQATDIALLGQAKAEQNPALFRRAVMRDAPDLIHAVAGGSSGVTRRIVGEMVHQALRWWRLPGTTPDLRRMLDSYAWEQGLTDPQMIEEAISRAADLLQRTESSQLFRQINEASQVYRELPFTFRLDERTINGVIDVLFFSKYQRWTVVDYKTSFVGPEYGERFPERIAAHAARYYAQIGVYAAAVESLTGQTPDTYLHYVRYVHSLRIAPETWRGVLQSLDAEITAALSGNE